MSGGWQGSTRRVRLPADWPEIRAYVLRRDAYQCRIITAGKRCTSPASDVDHIHGDDDHRPEVLQSICQWHHGRKSSAEGNRARVAKHSMRRPAERHPGLI